MIRYLALAALSGAALFGIWHYAQGEGAPENPEQIASLKPVESVAVETPNSKVKFPSKAKLKVADAEVDLTITGTALRKKLGFNVYAIASYLQTGEIIKSADDLCQNAKVKMLHLVMERSASGKDFIKAFRDAVGDKRADGEFKAEFKKLAEGLADLKVEAGNTILIISVPEKGLAIRIGDRQELSIETVAFARAIWEIYMGQKPIEEDIKKNLTRQLNH